MKGKISIGKSHYTVDFSTKFDISLPISTDPDHCEAFFIPNPKIEPLRAGTFVGDIRQNGPVNCEQVLFCPHGNGTHTECVGHITKERISIHNIVKKIDTFLPSLVISVHPELLSNSEDAYGAKNLPTDKVISKRALTSSIHELQKRYGTVDTEFFRAIVLRTLPNDEDKKANKWSGTNPPYLTEEAMKYLKSLGTRNLLVDLPSVDREEDDGMLVSHSEFFDFDKRNQKSMSPELSTRTITELCFIPNDVVDGLYLLDLQVTPIHLDAAPTRPVLYSVLENQALG